ncbi:hypothetical protein ACP4OV_030280 [Aristida adscensionis]
MSGELYLSASLLFSVSALAAAAASDAVSIAVYWGQDAGEGTLRDTCGSGLYAYVNLAFLATFGGGRAPVLNLAGHCDAPSGTCASLAADVASCQSAGVKVLLSVGGGALGGYNLSSPSDAQGVAAYLWDNFLGGAGAAGAPRPLGDAVLDGIDFDIESPSRYYDDLARNLTSLYRGDARGRKFMLTAAPQCPYPDYWNATNYGFGPAHPWIRKREHNIIAGATVAGILLLFLLIATCFLCHKKYRGIPPSEEGSTNAPAPTKESSQPKQRPHHLKRYTYSEVERMTKTFAHKVGHGTCGDVYRGNLRDGRQVAVKVLKNSKGDDKEFMNEVASIGRISHDNVVPFLGFCLQGPTRALIYDYMPNGSLESYALNKNDSVEENYSLWLYWEKLFGIAIGVARGLEYLHGEGSVNFVHLNVKPRNILLDQDLCPKISDVRVSNFCVSNERKRSSRSAGERDGYDAPEVVSRKFGAVSSKSDVYSYGVIVLELVRAKRSISVGADTTSKYFAQWLYEHLDQFCNSISDISGETRGLVKKMIIVGLWCIQTAQLNRPSMSRVVEMLESNSMDLELPVRIS